MMASQLKKSTIKTNAKKQHASIFLQAEKTPLSIILRPKWKGSRSRRLEKENEPRCPQCGSSSSTAEAGTVIPYPEHLTDAVQRKEWPVLVSFLEVLLSFREILEELPSERKEVWHRFQPFLGLHYLLLWLPPVELSVVHFNEHTEHTLFYLETFSIFIPSHTFTGKKEEMQNPALE